VQQSDILAAVGTTAKIVAISYLALVVVGIVVSIALVRTTRLRHAAVNAEELARRERTWLGIVIALLVALLLATIFYIPYGASAGTDRQVVRVRASQFAWRLDPATVKAGTPVEFELTSADVNHGFGVYDANDVLLFQVQVIPGKTQRTVHTFDRPGTYRILCLEFCGFAHHLMESTITVVSA
jgi:cytochrome c oxidase subunit 2